MSKGPFIWVRSEVFDHGVFNTSARWTPPKVLDFVASLREVVTGTDVDCETWVQAATERCKPALSESEARAFFHTAGVLQRSILRRAPELMDIRTIGLMLMCQSFSPHRVRTDLLAKGREMWPGFESRAPGAAGGSSPRHSPRSSSPRVAASVQSSATRGRDASGAMLAFVRQHLAPFFQIACLSLSAEPSWVAAEEFDILGLILCGGSLPSKPYGRVSEAVPELCNSSKPLHFRDLLEAVETCLSWNEEVYSPIEYNPAVRTVNITGLNRTTWFQRSLSAEIDFVTITSCIDCVIYIPTHVHFCLIAGCHECTVIMGAVSEVCTVHTCEKISVHVAAHCFKMENSIDSAAYLFCHIPPILTGDTRGIKLAPFNVLYSNMGTVLQRAQMDLEAEFVDTWAHPICCELGSPDETLGAGRSGSLDEPSHSTYHFVRPANFQPVVVPESPGSAPPAVRCQWQLCLPQVYDDALKKMGDDMQNFQKMTADIVDEGRRKRAQQAIQGHFREWLQSTGKARQLADLARATGQ